MPSRVVVVVVVLVFVVARDSNPLGTNDVGKLQFHHGVVSSRLLLWCCGSVLTRFMAQTDTTHPHHLRLIVQTDTTLHDRGPAMMMCAHHTFP